MKMLDGLTAVVLAGGYQSRFAIGVNKMLAPIGGRRVVDYLMDSMADVPIKRFLFLLGKSGDMDHPDDIETPRGVECLTVKEWPPSGTAGALRNIPFGFNESFFVLNGDTITLGIDHGIVLDAHKKTLAFISVATDMKGKSCGTYVFSPEALSMIGPDVKSLEHECIPLWAREGKKTARVSSDVRILDVGTAEGYAEACLTLPQWFEVGR